MVLLLDEADAATAIFTLWDRQYVPGTAESRTLQ
jgi:hypothetical protein